MLKPGSMLKPYLPNSLFWRAFMILVLPILLLQAVVAMVFIQRHYEAVTQQMAGSVAREINFVIDQVDNSTSQDSLERTLRELGQSLNVSLAFFDSQDGPPPDTRDLFDLTGSVVSQTLRKRIRNPISLDFISHRKSVVIDVYTGKGVLQVIVGRRQLNAANPHLLLVWMAGTAIALTAVAT
ncbi:MAG: hypothetical protein AAGH74_17750, partial [Pseudomonadota bacterium]